MSGELAALLLADARLPVGGHAYSAGLEPAVIAGLTGPDVPAYIQARLRTVGLVEAAAAVLALRAASTSVDRLSGVHDALLARTPSAPLREVSGMLGRGLSRLVTRLWPDRPEVAALQALGRAPQRPIALGVIAAVAGVGDESTARASLYDDAQTVASAALKLLPVDPVTAVNWVLAAEPVITSVIREAIAVDSPADLPAVTAPQCEGWSLVHHQQTRRIFVA